ncbi:Endonuclease/exonuclease/phosphatase [Cercophora samala]|uniref:Endonuclease/exonuclease/phosphatase n=1 Tax=Cercophora samala TaxID=330535 RepID=A0AA39Z8T2_9PEZI|nr:Endonuclease/exonuclease/phosphatase [Cercophora samala]
MGGIVKRDDLPAAADITIDIDVTTSSSPESSNNNNNNNNEMKLPKAVEVLVLTFNCAKNAIDVPVFGGHLRGVLLEQDGGGGELPELPELVVMSLQEIAPLSYSFLGEWFLGGYYAAFGEALNFAGRKYTLVKGKNVGMTAVLLFALHPERVVGGGGGVVEEGEVGFGAADMGNKGAVGLRVRYSTGAAAAAAAATSDGQQEQATEMTFVATHLAAMEWNLKKRNANWRSIVSGLTFGNPLGVLPRGVVLPAKLTRTGVLPDRSGVGERTQPVVVDSSEEEDAPLLSAPSTFSVSDDNNNNKNEDEETTTTTVLTPEQKRQLQDMSIFKPGSHLFVAGDLNYRISSTTPPPGSAFPSFDTGSENYYMNFLARDQLTQERLAGRTFHGMSEAEVTFGPTYKYDVLEGPEGAENEMGARQKGEVPWRFAGHRWPAWTDRVLYSAAEGTEVEAGRYGCLPVVRSSDHRAVFFRARVPLTGAGGGVKTEAGVEERKKLPVDIDVYSWDRRQSARRRELVVGLLALVWSTREGAVFLGTVVMVGMGWWWFARGGFF